LCLGAMDTGHGWVAAAVSLINPFCAFVLRIDGYRSRVAVATSHMKSIKQTTELSGSISSLPNLSTFYNVSLSLSLSLSPSL
jgi:hypothetical protein